MLQRLLRRDRLDFGTRGGFASGVVLTVPPFPYRHGYAELSKGLPIVLDPALDAAAREAIAWGEVAQAPHGGGSLVAAGACGYLGVATGCGETVAAASAAALALARRVTVPNLRYRTDIGQRVVDGEWARLQALGWLGADAPA